ncbi:unnamed protein product [Prorocentrum cordatum]|uniref:Uncharacterized protein n=1 Tax=Prorocentrum cordatum TaxID=2364126 RepID=A0ABN9VXB1_9DINO|nr:unnamed protein product [Polarella glacialis]
MVHTGEKGWSAIETKCFLPSSGIAWAIMLLLTVVPNGVVFMAPPCSDWTWLNSYTSGRYLSEFGHVGHPGVKASNTVATAVSMLMWMCHMRGLYYMVEQPKDSSMFKFPAMASMIEMTNGSKLLTYQGPFGAAIPKPTVLLRNMGDELTASLVKPSPPRGSMKANVCWTSNAGVFKGASDLKATEHYPTSFAQELANVAARAVGLV